MHLNYQAPITTMSADLDSHVLLKKHHKSNRPTIPLLNYSWHI